MLAAQGLLAVQAEAALVAGALRRGAGAGALSPEELSLRRACLALRTALRRATSLRALAPQDYFGPFLAVVRSERTGAHVTGLALSAIHKFLSYGLMDPTHPSVPATVENIADAVTHARFVGTDHSSDGVVLMKILQVLRTLMLSPEGAMLTGDSVCEIMLSCFRICFETRLTELLRRNADHCLRDMIQHVFLRLPQFSASMNLDIESVKELETFGANKKSNMSDCSVRIPSTRNDSVKSEESLSIHLDTLATVDENSTMNLVQTVDGESDDDQLKQALITSPSKKHGRHSSMDLASNDNIFITQLVEKCVIQSEVSETHSETVKGEPDAIDDNTSVEVKPEEDKEGESQSEDTKKEDTETVCAIKYEEKMKENEEDYINPRGVRFVPYDEQTTLQPYGVSCVKELFRFLISLCNPMDAQNSSSMVYLGLSLLETALEVTGDHFAQHPAILQLIKDPLSRNLISLLDSERVSIFALDLQVSFLLFECLRTHLKFQMESFFTKLVEIIMSDNAKNSYESKEITHLAIESIGQMWRIPGLCTELYLNYDCDVYSSNLFEDITKLLSKSIVASGIVNYHALALDALFSVIEFIENNSQQMKSNEITNEGEVKELKDDQEKYISIDMEDCEESLDGTIIHDISHFLMQGMLGRHKVSTDLPSRQELTNIKNRKRWIATGTELFNQKPEKGIEYLQEHGILSVPLDPLEIANFLKHNPGLDKKQIGEYISKKKNVESRILATYVSSFDMAGLRIDQALRLYLETFRLPGEAPLIFLVMEHFAEHWSNCNGHPFANTDAAFRLAYAVIMLNMDQHNDNAKKLNIPMTMEDFVKNLRGCNGNSDFDQKMLEAVFSSIKNEEIVMPAERKGIVKENYLWKVLLRRGVTKEGVYLHCPSGIYDLELFMVTWGPLVAALSSIFEKSQDPDLYTQALEGFDKCAVIVGCHSLTNELDTLILSLCKFSGLLNLPEHVHYIQIGTALGQTVKMQLALKKVFAISHRHADSIREGWKHILEVLLALFKGHLLSKSLTEADDFCSPSGKMSLINEPSQQTKTHEPGLLSSLYSYIALSSENNALRNPNPEEAELIEVANECVSQCNIDTLLLTDSKFLQLDSLQELVKYIINAGKPPENQIQTKMIYDDPTIFYLELLIKIVIQNRDRVSHVWEATESHVIELMMLTAESTHFTIVDKLSSNNMERISFNFDNNPSFSLLERSSTGLLRLAINLMRNEECASMVLRSLKNFLELSYPVYHHIASQIAIGLFELVKTSAQNIHSADDWALVFTLLETTGAGAMHLTQDESIGIKSDGAVSSEDESVSTDRGYTSEGELSHSPPSQGWILVGKDAEGQTGVPENSTNPLVHPCALRPHDPHALLKCWECLAFIVRDVAHITPYNFESCVNCIRTFVEASLHGTNQSKITAESHPMYNKENKRKRQLGNLKRAQKNNKDNSINDARADANAPEGYQLISIQLLDLMHTLHSRTAQIFKWWREEANFGNATSTSESGTQTNTGVEWCNLWTLAWQPLLQGIARLCTDNRKQVSNGAVTYLQRALLVHDLQTLSGEEWEACFHCVLFPLLSRLTNHHDDIRLRANTIMCKVFLHHLTPLLGRPSFSNLWLSLLDLMRSLMTGSHTTDLLYEATLESLKNMLLVMDSVKVFNDGDSHSELWGITWNRINTFLPKLKEELFKPIEKPVSYHQDANKERHQQHSAGTTSPQASVSQFPAKVLPNQTSPVNVQIPTVDTPKVLNNNISLIQNSTFTPTLTSGSMLNSNLNIQNQILNSAINNTVGRGSIILQPPAVGSQVHSPLFTHLGQMVSTPIGVAHPVSSSGNMPPPYPILCPTPLPPKYFNNPMINQTATPSHITLVSPNVVKVNQNIEKSAFDMESRLKCETVQPQSLYGDYLVNPYNVIAPTEPVVEKNSNISHVSADSNPTICDSNLNSDSAMNVAHPHLQKSQSVTSSPHHIVGQVNSNFGSSDNIKYMSSNPADGSGMFSFSKYFYQDTTNIPPGSEILFGDK